VALGAEAVFSFPVSLDSIHLGALNLYRDRAGTLTEEQQVSAVVLGGMAARAVLTLQAEAPPGCLAPEIDAAVNLRLGIHRAAGMIAADLHISVADGLCRLRAYAFSNGRRTSDVAHDVLARRLKLGDASDQSRP